ncbi:MAG: hypothetical protein V1820_04310 [archaeon]
MRRSFVFSLDALAAISVISLAVLSIYLLSEASRPEAGKYQYLSTVSRDIITVLEKTKVSEAREIPIIESYIQGGAILPSDFDKRLVDVIGAFYAADNSTAAGAVLSGVFSSFLPSRLYYRISIDNTTILENSREYSSALSTRAVISGYAIGRPTSGYISRAWLGTARGNFTDVIEISPLGSGFSSAYSSTYGNLTFTKYFNLSSTDNLTATLYLSLHEESGWVFPFVNGQLQAIPPGNECYHPTDACYDSIVLDSGDFQVGQNAFRMTLGTPADYHTHTHPGMLLVLNYNDNRQTNFVQSRDVYEEINLTAVSGRPSAWETAPFSIPAGAKINSATAFVKGEGVNKAGEIWINTNRVWYNTSSGCSSCITSLNNVGITKNILSYLNKDAGSFSTGETNTIAVYLDIPASGSGVDYPVSGASAFANISGTSVLRLNYTLANPIVEFNKVPVTNVFALGGSDSLTKSVNFTIPNATLVSAYFHDVQRYSYKIAVAVWKRPTESEPSWQGSPNYRWSNYQIFKSPDARNIPSTLYIPLTRLQVGVPNTLKARDGFDGGSSSNFIMANSTIEYTILVPASVPYGDAFSGVTEAEADANARLTALLAPYNLTGTPASDTANIAGISWLWGPSEMKVVVGI